MAKCISFGQFNEKHLYILGLIIVKFILHFIDGFNSDLSLNNTIYIFGFKNFISYHPLFSYCLEYFSMFLGGIILHIIYSYKNKTQNNDEESGEYSKNIARINGGDNGDILDQILKEEENRDKHYLKQILLVFSIYFLSQIVNTFLNELGFNNLKLWPLESIFIYLYLKKILNRTMYKHQKITIITMVIYCSTIFIILTFIPSDDKDCSLVSDEEKEQCEKLTNNIYNSIIKYFDWFYIPIFIIIYVLIMIGNAYSTVSIKWLSDIKYITIQRILIYIGIIGFIFSFIALFVFSFIPCKKENNYIMSLCSVENEDKSYYVNYKNLKFEKIDLYFYIDIFITIPLFLISSFLEKFFELLIIINLDPFYFIPIDSAIFLCYEIIDYSLTFSITNKYRDTKFALLLLCDSHCVFLCLIYLEIIELHFCNLDMYLRRNILRRESDDSKFIVLKDTNEITDDRSDFF